MSARGIAFVLVGLAVGGCELVLDSDQSEPEPREPTPDSFSVFTLCADNTQAPVTRIDRQPGDPIVVMVGQAFADRTGVSIEVDEPITLILASGSETDWILNIFATEIERIVLAGPSARVDNADSIDIQDAALRTLIEYPEDGAERVTLEAYEELAGGPVTTFVGCPSVVEAQFVDR